MTRLRRHRRWPWAVLVVLIALLALAWWFPARWAWWMVRDNYPAVHVARVGGSVWYGHADGVVARGRRLGTLEWTLDRAAVFGHVQGHFKVHGGEFNASGAVARAGAHAVVIRDARFRIPMSSLKVLWPSGTQLGGALRGTIARARLVQGWPAQLDADVRWQGARINTQAGTVDLGVLRSHWNTAAGTVVKGTFRGDGKGPLRVRGHCVVTTLGWRLVLTLTPRPGAPAALRELLRRFGPLAADGSLHIERHGGLMMGASE